MLMVVKNYFRFFVKSLKCNMLSILEYKKSFLIQCIFMMINNGAFLIFWSVVFGVSDGAIHDITMNDILYLWSIPTTSYGIAFFFFGGIRNLGKYILEGGLDTYLIEPKNLIINVMMSGMDFSAAGDMLYGLIIGLFAVEFNMIKYVGIVLLSIIGSVFYICTEIIIRSLTVHIGNTDNIEHTYMNTLLINFSVYPEKIYGGFVKILIYTIIPAAYVAFIPIKIVKEFSPLLIFVMLLMAFVYIFASGLITKKMIKDYESGNNIALRG